MHEKRISGGSFAATLFSSSGFSFIWGEVDDERDSVSHPPALSQVIKSYQEEGGKKGSNVLNTSLCQVQPDIFKVSLIYPPECYLEK